MSTGKFPIKFNLEDRNGKVLKQGSIDHAKDTQTFGDIPSGIYQARGKCADGSSAESNAEYHRGGDITFIAGDLSQAPPPFVEKKIPRKGKAQTFDLRPSVTALTSFALGMTLLGNLGGAESLINEISAQLLNSPTPQTSQTAPQQRPGNPQSRPGSSSSQSSQNDDIFPPAVEARLRSCIQSNLVDLSGVPTLSGLLESVSWERGPEGEFERQVIFFYTRVQQLQATIEVCDPTLIQEILAAQEQVNVSEPELDRVVVVGELVNVRSGPSPNHAILGQVVYGTSLAVDQETFATLPPNQKWAIEEGTGWQPVFLPAPDGRRGYIYSLYVDVLP